MLEFVNSNLYSVVAGITLLVHLIINWRELADWRNAGSGTGALEVRRFLACLSVFFLTDVLWGVFLGLGWPRVLYADTVLFFLTMALSVFTWSRYVVAYLEMVGVSRWCALWMGRGLLAFFAVALVVNGFVGGFFSIGSDCVYKEGPVRQLSLLLLVAFNAIGVVLTRIALRRKKGALRRRCRMVFAFGVTMTAAIVLQLADPFLPLYGLGCLFGCCLLHVFVIEDERDEMHRKELLARDVGAQLEAERARCISSIRSSAKVLARLVDDVLDLSKLESGKLEIVEEPTDVPVLVRGVRPSACRCPTRRSLPDVRRRVEEVHDARRRGAGKGPSGIDENRIDAIGNELAEGRETLRKRIGPGLRRFDFDRLQPARTIADKIDLQPVGCPEKEEAVRVVPVEGLLDEVGDDEVFEEVSAEGVPRNLFRRSQSEKTGGLASSRPFVPSSG